MTIKFRFLVLLFICFTFTPIKAQVFGGFPASKKWFQLDTEEYRIVYSSENEKTARQTAAIIEQMNRLSTNIGKRRRKIDIILQSSTTQANGYVGLAPFVSEFFLSPFPNSFAIGSLPWPYTLGVHEYQHVLQNANTYYGISKLSYWIGGEQTWNMVQRMSVPNWFFEGDAVRAETQYSQQGRGRIPAFFNGYRAFVLEKNIPSYAKARNGSIQDYMPNHYPLGYLMVRYGRKQQGAEYWPNVLKRASSYRDIVYPFSRSLKKEGLQHSTKFYQSMIKDFSTTWNDYENDFGKALFTTKNQEVSNYQFPQFDIDGSLYFFNSTYDKIGKIYQLKENKLIEKYTPGIRSENYFDIHDGIITTTQTHFDKRWGWIDYEDIILFDSKTGIETQLTKKGKYFHPSFSPNGEKIVANYVHPDHTFELHILDSKTGEIIDKVANPNNFYYTYPIWKNETEIVSAARDSIGQMFLAIVNSKEQSITTTARSFHIIGRPYVKDNLVYYSASYSGVDNLYSYDGNVVKQISQLGSGRYAPTPSPSNDSIYFTEFTLNGTQLKSAPLTSGKEITIQPLNQLSFYNETYNETEIISPLLSNDSVPAKSYPKFSHPINFHSWGFTFDGAVAELNLESDNVLNTLNVSTGYSYNVNENEGGFSASAIYGQYYLNILASVSRFNRSIERLSSPDIKFTETKSTVGLALPLNYSSGLYSRALQFISSYSYSLADFESERFLDQKIHSTSIQAIYRQVRLKARKNIFTHFGIYSRIKESKGLNESANQLLLQNSLALAGISRNHNFVVDADAQFDDGANNYRFTDLFIYPRGFQNIRFNEMFRISGNYHFPLFYPDKGALGIAYLLRVRANLFTDYAWSSTANRDFSSVGGELIFDARFFNLIPISLGIRYTQILNQQSFSETGNNGIIEVIIPAARF